MGATKRTSTNETAVIKPALLSCGMVLLLREGIPEPQRFVPCTSHDRLALRTHREVEHTMRMAGERRDHVE